MLVLAGLGSGCSHDPQPSPLGTFTNEELADWAKDCATPLLDERVCGSLPARADCADHFHSIYPYGGGYMKDDWATAATRRIRCGPPGWSLWTDDRGRVIAVCADDVGPPPQLNATLRFLELITDHWNKRVSDQIFAMISDPHLIYNWEWWSWIQPVVPRLIMDDVEGIPRVVSADPTDERETRCLEFMLHK
jgi:hypothetical protein